MKGEPGVTILDATKYAGARHRYYSDPKSPFALELVWSPRYFLDSSTRRVPFWFRGLLAFFPARGLPLRFFRWRKDSTWMTSLCEQTRIDSRGEEVRFCAAVSTGSLGFAFSACFFCEEQSSLFG